MNETTFTVEPDKQEIIIERTFNAPVAKVFDAFVDAEKVVKWWGGKTYDTKVDVYEPRNGGSWRMVQSDGNGEY